MTTKAEVHALLRQLAQAFKTRKPTVRWNIKTKGASANYAGVITIGPNCWRGLKTGVVHEFTHVIHNRRSGDGGRGEINHGENYYHWLVAVAREAYGDPGLYPWATEYKTLQARARRNGLLVEASQAAPR